LIDNTINYSSITVHYCPGELLGLAPCSGLRGPHVAVSKSMSVS